MKSTVLSIVLTAAAGAAQGGVTLKSVDGAGQQTAIAIEGNRLRIDERHLRTYSLTNERDMKKMGAELKQQMDASQAEMRKQMASMPPEQRKQMEEAMKGMQQAGPGATRRSRRTSSSRSRASPASWA